MGAGGVGDHALGQRLCHPLEIEPTFATGGQDQCLVILAVEETDGPSLGLYQSQALGDTGDVAKLLDGLRDTCSPIRLRVQPLLIPVQ